jgi:UDP-glucose 4-epimerase
MEMTALVTGGAGFIGTNLVKRLLLEGHNVVVIDDFSSGKQENCIDDRSVLYLGYHTKDLLKAFNELFGTEGTERFRNIDVVFHLGEYSKVTPSYDDIFNVVLSNVVGTSQVIEFCRQNKIMLVYAASSTKHGLGMEHSPYSYTKSNNTEILNYYHKWFGLKSAVCYFYNVFGPLQDTCNNGWETVISIFEKQYKEGKPLTVCGDGSQERVFTHVEDIVLGLIKAWKFNEYGEYCFAGDGDYTILEIAKMFSDNIEFIPERKGDRKKALNFTDLTREKLGWKPKHSVTSWIQKTKDEHINSLAVL